MTDQEKIDRALAGEFVGDVAPLLANALKSAWDEIALLQDALENRPATFQPGDRARVLRNMVGAHLPGQSRADGEKELRPGDVITVQEVRGQSLGYWVNVTEDWMNWIGSEDVELVKES